jgi:hypothetical protein
VPDGTGAENPWIALVRAALEARFLDLAYAILVLAASWTCFNLTPAETADGLSQLVRKGLLVPMAFSVAVMVIGCIRVTWRSTFGRQ